MTNASAPIAAFQMDALELLNPKSDSTLLLMAEALKRGYRLFHYTPDKLTYAQGKITARGHFVQIFEGAERYFVKEEEATINLADVKIVWLRQDPPFDMAYITSTFILEALPSSVLVANNPEQVRNCPEKWFVNQFPEFLPPTLISADAEAIIAFRHQHKEVIIKPLYGHGGNAVFHLQEGDANLKSLLELMFHQSNVPVIAQKFLPEVRGGDIRVILVDGEVAGQIGRVPAAGEIRSNFRVGGSAAKLALSPRQLEICEALKPELQKRGLLFVGIDLIGDYLTEINVTSPTGLRAVNLHYDTHLETSIWDAVERKLSNR